MEKLLRPYDKECMKLAILKHEETFREQVYELHRLYQIQKVLMKDIESGSSGSMFDGEGMRQERLNGITDHNSTTPYKSKMKVDFGQLAGELNNVRSEEVFGDNVEILDESEIELTLGPTIYKNRRRTTKVDTPLTSDSGLSFSSSSTGSSSHNNGSNAGAHQSDLVQTPYRSKAFERSGDASANTEIQEEHMRESVLKQPPWLFHVLSLNSS